MVLKGGRIENIPVFGETIYKIPIMILTESVYTLDTTLAHEIGHNLGLRDIDDQNKKDNLMWGYNDRTDHNLELAQVNAIKTKLGRYPEPYSRNQAPVSNSP
jgi:hypothetical protein